MPTTCGCIRELRPQLGNNERKEFLSLSESHIYQNKLYMALLDVYLARKGGLEFYRHLIQAYVAAERKQLPVFLHLWNSENEDVQYGNVTAFTGSDHVRREMLANDGGVTVLLPVVSHEQFLLLRTCKAEVPKLDTVVEQLRRNLEDALPPTDISVLWPFNDILYTFLEYDYGDGPGASFTDAVLSASETVHLYWAQEPDKSTWVYGEPGHIHILNMHLVNSGQLHEWSITTTGFPDTKISLPIPLLDGEVYRGIREEHLRDLQVAHDTDETLSPEKELSFLLQAHPSFPWLKHRMWEALHAQIQTIRALKEERR